MKKTADQPAGDGALRTLLETERRIADLLDDARRDAARIVADARKQAEADEHAATDALSHELAELDATHRQSLHDEIAQITASATRDAAAYDAIDAARIDALAAWVVDRVLAS